MKLASLEITVAIAALLGAGAAEAAMVAKPVEYDVDGTKVRSVVVYDDAAKTERPGLIMVPNWKGVSERNVEKAKKIAGDDYVVFVADVFGAEVRPVSDADSLQVVRGLYKDLPTLKKRVAAAQAELGENASGAPLAKDKIGAIGFCFGGGAVLEHLRAGGKVAGIATFHANLDTPNPLEAKPNAAKVLVLNGANDSSVPREQLAGFEDEMNAAKVDWQVVNLSGAVHCFTEEGDNNPPNCVYDAKAAKRAYGYMHDFFAEAFGSAGASAAP